VNLQLLHERPMSSENETNIFPPAPLIGGPLTQDQIWAEIIRMSKFSKTITSELEQSVNEGRQMVKNLGIKDRVPEDVTAAQVEQDGGKIVSDVA
jgi:hypothetical protein